MVLKKYSSYDLLILDEWLFEDFTESSIQFIFELIERRYDNTATIFCTQYPKKDWHSHLGGGIHADSIMDRIVSYVISYSLCNHSLSSFYWFLVVYL